MTSSQASTLLSQSDERIRVLHVDDDPGFLDLCRDALQQEHSDIEVITETSVDAGLDTFETAEIDCIVSDYDMPGTNGLDFLEAVREVDPNVPFILFTGKGSEEVASEALSAGATDYLQKDGGLDQFQLLANRLSNAVETARVETHQNHLLRAIETAQEGISILDEEGVFVYVNEAYADLYGYDPSKMVGKHWELIYPDDRVDYVRDDIIPTVEESSYWHGETIGLRADGTTFVEDHALARTDTGELICTSRDKTAEKEQREALDASRRQFEAVFNDPGLFVHLLDLDGTIRRVNETVLDAVSLSREEIEGRPFFDASLWGEGADGEVVEEIREWVTRAADGEYVNYEYDISRSDIGMQVVEGTVRPVRDDDGSVRSLIVSARDVTARTKYESGLADLHAGTRQLVRAESMQEVADIASRTADKVLGLPMNGVHLYDEDEDALVPVAVSEATQDLLGAVPQLDQGLAWESYQRGEQAVYNDVHDTQGDYDDDSPMHSEMFLPLGDHGILIVSSPDVDAFDETDETLATILADNVESALDRMEHERRLERRTEQLDEFASVVSHDLRNPLNTLKLSLDMGAQTGDEEHFQRCHRAVDRMNDLVDDLLTLARQGTSADVTDVVDLGLCAEGCWKTVETADADLVVESGCRLTADEGRLQQLFENLFRNSIEHGGEDVRVTVGCLKDGFFVADDGTGIPEDIRERVFEGGFTTQESGTGFGLQIVSDIADAHGWAISAVESADGGARFEITGVERHGDATEVTSE